MRNWQCVSENKAKDGCALPKNLYPLFAMTEDICSDWFICCGMFAF